LGGDIIEAFKPPALARSRNISPPSAVFPSLYGAVALLNTKAIFIIVSACGTP